MPDQNDPKERRSYGYIGAPKEKRPFPWAAVFLFPFTLLAWLGHGLRALFNKRLRLSGRKAQAFRGIFRTFFLTSIILLFVGGTLATIWVSRDLPDPNRLTDRQVAQSTKIFDRSGEHLLYEIFADQKRTIVELEDMPKDLINGVIATEDTDFYNHHGIRPLSILRSVVTGIFTEKAIGSGASTLTQQLVKNTILSKSSPYTRKPKELILSLRLEQKYTKDQILKIYFNEIPYGSTNYGVEAAARSYFGKSVKDLTLEESATLAGIPQRPSVFLRNPEALLERRNFVLRRMYEEGFITKEQKEGAQAKPLTLEQRFNKIEAPHFVEYVKAQLYERYGEPMVDTGGLKVITSLDFKTQKIAEQALKEESEKLFTDANANNAAFVAANPKTGEILAMIGSRDFFDKNINGEFNVATLGKRQPGSSFKPIVYAAAFEKGFTPDTVLYDVATNFSLGSTPYEPKNYDLTEHGLVTMRKAIQGSLNIPAVKTLYLVGEKKAIKFAERLGYTTLSNGDFGLTLVLGGGEVHLLDHVFAFGVFANNGVKMSPVSILRIEDNKGHALFENETPKGERVLDEKVSSLISNVLNDDNARAFAFGSLGILTLKNRPVAAKTGTTNNYVDAWTMGYTPSLVAGVWVGNTDNTPMKRGFGGNRLAGAIWNHFMRNALEGTPVEKFPDPPANDAEKPVLRGSDGGITLKVNSVTGKLAVSTTPPDLIVDRTYFPPHDILHYVDKDDPRGPRPTDPSVDPQYFRWEESLQNWITRRQTASSTWDITLEEPPTEFDDPASFELIPTIEVFSPAASSTFSSRVIETDVRILAPRGVNKVTYLIDGSIIATFRAPPFSLHQYVPELTQGDHTLLIRAEDDLSNRRETFIPFHFTGSDDSATVLWNNPARTVSASDFPAQFRLDYGTPEKIREVSIYKQKEGETGKTLLWSFVPIANSLDSFRLFSWNEAPEPATWFLSIDITLATGAPRTSDSVAVVVE